VRTEPCCFGRLVQCEICVGREKSMSVPGILLDVIPYQHVSPHVLLEGEFRTDTTVASPRMRVVRNGRGGEIPTQLSLITPYSPASKFAKASISLMPNSTKGRLPALIFIAA
jgi:hypothetical protein